VEVRLSSDTRRGFEPQLTLSEPAPVEALVRAWLADLLAAAGVSGSLCRQGLT
jgi:hypothetical protein